ncbi:hypothetical protein FRC09_002636 [Ceratobasidium sp. 395]|nr:hypothetical protein FRC09_002636 [Ceratobasidium sp. 395]
MVAVAPKKLPALGSTIDKLPFETIAHTFKLSDLCFIHKEGRCLLDFASVCTRWRQIVMNMSTYHVDAGPTVPSSLTKQQLERTGSIPISVHVYEPEAGSLSTQEWISTTTGALIGHLHRVRSLDIESDNGSETFVDALLNLWLEMGTEVLAKSLTITRNSKQYQTSMLRSGSERAVSLLRSLKRLDLRNIMLAWDSGAYRGLTDLRLDFPTNYFIPISVLQVREILLGSPLLVVLELNNLRVSDTCRALTPITLRHLRRLALSINNPGGLYIIISSINLPTCPVEISIACTPLLLLRQCFEDFLARTPHLTVLKLWQYGRGKPQEVFSFLKALPRLDGLVLLNFHMGGVEIA